MYLIVLTIYIYILSHHLTGCLSIVDCPKSVATALFAPLDAPSLAWPKCPAC